MKHNIILSLILLYTFVNVHPEDIYYLTKSFNAENGLTQNDVTSITQDCSGFVWMATNNGLNRFDGHRIVTFKHSLDTLKESISENLITSIVTDSANCLWIAYKKKGIDCYNLRTNSFEHFNCYYYNNEKSEPLSNIVKIQYSPSKNIYACTNNVIVVYDHDKHHFITHELNQYLSEYAIQISDIFFDTSEKSIFIATNKGVFQYEVEKQNLIRHSKIQSNIVFFQAQSNVLIYKTRIGLIKKELHTGKEQILTFKEKPITDATALLTDSNGNLWIGTRNGLYIEKKGQNLEVFNAIAKDHILSIYEDKNKIIWIGKRTYGASSISPKPRKFQLYNKLDGNNDFTPASFAIYPENNDTIWIGTKNGKLYSIDRRQRKILADIKFPEGNINAICSNKNRNELYLAGTNGLYTFNKFTKLISYIEESSKNGSITSMYIEPDSTLWCASRNGLFAYKHNRMSRVYPLKKDIRPTQNICRTVFVEKDTIWAGFSSSGLVKIIRNKEQFQCFPSEYSTLNGKDISFIRKSSNGDLLVGTWGNGVNILRNKQCINLTEENGLADNIVFSIYEDKSNNLWISTYNGLSYFNAKTKFFTKYEIQDGLPSNEFSVGAHFLSDRDEIFLGTVNGIISFFPSILEQVDTNTDIILTDMYLFDKKVEANSIINGNIILNEPLYKTNKITLPHDMNSFSFDITDFNYSSNIRPSIRYKLNGWDTQWNALPSDLSVRYTNLPPGNYQLNILRQLKDGSWGENTLLDICINPPFYATMWAYSIYSIIFILSSISIIYRIKQQNKLKLLLFEESTQKKYQEQLYLTRMKFYTNISHELRTPLTLILGMIEKIKNEIDGEPLITKQLEIAKRNADKLHLLINDILDLRKIENKSMDVRKEYRNIVSFLETIISYFREISEEKHIEIEFYHSSEILICTFDIDKTEKIIYNLLSNAIKYTKDRIIVSLDTTNEEDKEFIVIKVNDNGPGINEKECDKIFQRYYQAENSAKIDSSGIGLNIALEMARLQGGDISVKSTQGEGASFIFTLPKESNNITTSIDALEKDNKPLILLVDDNEDILYYMTEILKNEYTIYTATNGHQAIETASKIIPDIIVCDIMMPDISGIEVCKKLKSDSLTNHITIILVSARGEEQSQIIGLSSGADIYISKPFSEDYFKAQIKSLLINRTIIKNQIRQELMHNGSEQKTYKDEILTKIIELVEQNLSSEDYNLEKLSRDMCMSQMSLYRKMKTCTDQSPGEFIRDYKLKKAAELLTQSNEYVSDICFQIGFNDLKTFRIAFKKKYGMTPSEYKKQIK